MRVVGVHRESKAAEMITRPRPFHNSGSTDVDVWTTDVFPAAQMR